MHQNVPREIAETWRWMCPAGVYEIPEDAPENGPVDVIVNYTNCVQCGAITAKGGRLTPPEGGDGPAVHGHLTRPGRQPALGAGNFRRTECSTGMKRIAVLVFCLLAIGLIAASSVGAATAACAPALAGLRDRAWTRRPGRSRSPR